MGQPQACTRKTFNIIEAEAEQATETFLREMSSIRCDSSTYRSLLRVAMDEIKVALKASEESDEISGS